MSQAMSPPGPSRRRGAYAPRACNNCRRRRCRCDGAQPICSTCAHSGHQCSWGPDDPDSRPATKQYIESLRVKIQMLETEISHLRSAGSHSGQLSDSTTPSETPFASPFGSFSQERIPLGSGMGSLQQMATVERDGTPVGAQIPIKKPVMIYRYIFSIDTTISMERQTPDVQATLVCKWNQHLPSLDGAHLSRQEHDMILYRCFMYGSTWLVGLVPELFLRDLLSSGMSPSAQTGLQHYSPLLHCSLLAFAAAFSDRSELRARATRDSFAAHAKQWLDEELSGTAPSLVVSLALLAEYHRSIGQTSVGYMYLGMCARATRNPAFKLSNAALQNLYRWSAFIQVKLMALESKPPCEAPLPELSTLPSILTALGGLSTTTEFGDTNDYKSVLECFTRSCKLLAIATQVINNVLVSTPDTNSRGGDINVQLQAWFDALPSNIRICSQHTLNPPHVLCLQMYYWWIILEYNLPWLNATRVLEHSPTPEEANNICAYATGQLLALIATFSAQHGLQFFPRTALQAVYTCGHALLVTRQWERVNVCILTLRTLGGTWPCAEGLADKLASRVSEISNEA